MAYKNFILVSAHLIVMGLLNMPIQSIPLSVPSEIIEKSPSNCTLSIDCSSALSDIIKDVIYDDTDGQDIESKDDTNFTPITNAVTGGQELEDIDDSLKGRKLNYRPIIGILSQELGRSMRKAFKHEKYNSYIAASYVKFVESAGARVVPLLINQSYEYYEKLSRSLNGFIFPGGSAPLVRSGYSKAAKIIFEIVKNQTEDRKLPLWATCLGFENLLYFEAGENPLTRCNASNKADPLFFQPGYEDSQLFGNMSKDLLKALATQNITANFHKWCVLPQTFYDLGLNESLNLLSTSKDEGDVEYVSTIEYKRLPIFGTQWHPEKAAFEWADGPKYDTIPHTIEAVRASQALAETFIEIARQNANHFDSEEEERKNLIYNFSPTYVAPVYKSSFQLCYYF